MEIIRNYDMRAKCNEKILMEYGKITLQKCSIVNSFQCANEILIYSPDAFLKESTIKPSNIEHFWNLYNNNIHIFTFQLVPLIDKNCRRWSNIKKKINFFFYFAKISSTRIMSYRDESLIDFGDQSNQILFVIFYL